MRLFRNLSVGRKLAASAVLAILLLGGLVLLVQRELAAAAEQQQAERQAVQARAAARQAALHVSRAAMALYCAQDLRVSQAAQPANVSGSCYARYRDQKLRCFAGKHRFIRATNLRNWHCQGITSAYADMLTVTSASSTLLSRSRMWPTEASRKPMNAANRRHVRGGRLDEDTERRVHRDAISLLNWASKATECCSQVGYASSELKNARGDVEFSVRVSGTWLFRARGLGR